MRKPYPFGAVLFDLDGVLIDTTEICYRVWDEFGRSQGFVPTRDQLLATNGRRADETIRLWLGPTLTDHQIGALTADVAASHNRLLATEPMPPVPRAAEFVRALQEAAVPVAVATSATSENARLALDRIGLGDVFGTVVSAADVMNGKPHPESYLTAARRLGVPAADSLVIEDSVSGIRAAKAAGARCLALTATFPPEVLAAESPDWLVSGFTHIPQDFWPNK
jgi:HAD superfamily hydrolase (TIGR01509 family)